MAERIDNIDQPAFPTQSDIHGQPYTGLTKLEAVAALITLDRDEFNNWPDMMKEYLVGRKKPVSGSIEIMKFDADFKSILKVMQATSIINAVDRYKYILKDK